MTVEFRGVSTASLGAMLKGYGVMAGVGAKWPDAAFEKARRKTKKEKGPDGKERKVVLREAGTPPLENEATWDSLDEALAVDAEGAGVFTGRTHRPNPVLARWGQDGSGNLFTVLREAGNQATRPDINEAIFGSHAAPCMRMTKGSGALFPDGIKRYATGALWIHEKKKPLGLWDFIMAMRGLLLFRGAVRAPRGSRHEYPAFSFVLPGTVVRAQGKPVQTPGSLPSDLVQRPSQDPGRVPGTGAGLPGTDRSERFRLRCRRLSPSRCRPGGHGWV